MGKPVRTVLVIEDHAAVRESMRRVLLHAGYAVLVAADGAAALEVLGRGVRPDVIVLDLMMPRMTGFEFLNVVRFRDDLAGLVIVVLSVSRAYEAEDLGVRAVLRKPCNSRDLLAALDRFASGGGDPSPAQR
jgi:CheY-like chemotaxis protein